MSRPLWVVGIIKRLFPSRMFVARMTKFPIFGRFMDNWLFEGDDMLYVPPNRVVTVGEDIETPGDLVLPSEVVEHFIRATDYHWIMNTCLCRESAGCEDYPIDLGCLFLGEAISGINPKLGRRVSQEEALDHLEQCRQAGLVHTVGRNKLDTVWLGIGPREKLMTVCNCCPCCCLWGVIPHVTPEIGDKIARMPGVTVRVTEQCIGCGACTEDVCFAQAIHLDGDRAVIDDACRACGRCVDACPQQAIELVIEDAQFVTRSIERLSTLVDLS